MFQKEFVEEFKKHVLCSKTFFFHKNCGIHEICGKIWYSQTGHTLKYNVAHSL